MAEKYTDGIRHLNYPSMEDMPEPSTSDAKLEEMAEAKAEQEERDIAKFQPAAASKKKFTAAQLARAKELVEIFAKPETRKRLKNSSWGDDPTIIGAVLAFGDRMDGEISEITESMQGGGLRYKDMDDILIRNQHQGFTDKIETALHDARDTWIVKHGPISNEQHPLDSMPINQIQEVD